MYTKETLQPGRYFIKCLGMICDLYQDKGQWWIGKGDDCWSIENQFERYVLGAKFQSHFPTWPGCEQGCKCKV